jgi:hypothetical protein
MAPMDGTEYARIRRARSPIRVRVTGGRSRSVAVRASANSPALANRSAGTLATALRIACSTYPGTVSRTVRIAGGSCTVFRARIACGFDPVNGGSPASISYTTHPRA